MSDINVDKRIGVQEEEEVEEEEEEAAWPSMTTRYSKVEFSSLSCASKADSAVGSRLAEEMRILEADARI